MGTLGQLWDMTSQISAQILGQSSLKSTLSLINGNCVYLRKCGFELRGLANEIVSDLTLGQDII